MGDDVIYNKIEIIERCIQRVYEEYQGRPENLENYTKQDSIILNIQRACEAVIDLAMHVVAEKKLGIPQNSRDAFELLEKNGLIDSQLAQKLKSVVGFRNIAVHNYQSLNLEIVKKIIEYNLKNLTLFGQTVLTRL